MWEWKPKYEANLRRLIKAQKYVSLALQSGTLRDTPSGQDARSAAKGALQFINLAINIQREYKEEHHVFS